MPYILRGGRSIRSRADQLPRPYEHRTTASVAPGDAPPAPLDPALARRRRLEFELTGASLIQQRLLPLQLPPTPGFEVAARCVPAETVGGDYYDVIYLADGAPALIVGDVSGHGLGPALLMAQTRGILRGLAQGEVDPGSLLHKANRLMLKDCDKGAFVTLFVARLDEPRRTIRFACAGHDALLVRGHLAKVQRLAGPAPPIGVVAGFDYVTHGEVLLDVGDVLLCCTDGITESYSAAGDRYFGWEGVLDSVLPARGGPVSALLDAIFVRTEAFQDAQHDDMTALVVRAAHLVEERK